MRALYISFLPQDAEGLKAAEPNHHSIMGASVYASGVFQALLKYSTYDRIFIPDVPRYAKGDPRDRADFAFRDHRLALISEQQLGDLQRYSPAVFMSSGIALWLLTRLRRLSQCQVAPITGTIHSINQDSFLQGMWVLMTSSLTSRDALICSSTTGRQGVENFIAAINSRLTAVGLPAIEVQFKLPVIPLGIDAASFATSVDTSQTRAALELQPGPVVLYFGRLSAVSKGDLLPLILGFAALHARHPTSNLVLAGDDTQFRMADDLRAFAAQIAPEACIRVVTNPDAEMKRHLYGLADVFVSPSDSLQETFGITVIEAMAAGLPTVVSDWNGYKDLVVEGETGLRVRTTLPEYPPRFDDLRGSGTMIKPDLLAATTVVHIPDLAQALCSLLENPERRRAMGEAGRKRARALYDWPAVIAAYEALWAELSVPRDCQRHHDSTWPTFDEFGYRQIFDHYPTDTFSEDVQVRVSPSARHCGDPYEWVDKTMHAARWFKRELFSAIMGELQPRGTVPVRTLIDLISDGTETERVVILTHVWRLMKYGMIEPVDGAR